MERRTSAFYQRRHRDRLREQGLLKKELWVLPEYADELAAIERQMRRPRSETARSGRQTGEPTMGESQIAGTPMAGSRLSAALNAAALHAAAPMWTASGLCAAIAASEPVREGLMAVELIEGAEPGLYMTMHDYGDLPLFMAVIGRQIVVEALLWPVSQVRDAARFNEALLRTHKLFPLSTLGIETLDGDPVYIMFGALSASSSLADVLFEIETLADNVIRATEAYETHLREAA
jgi:uncharacterized protein YjfI (DUF2170 family)